MLEAPLDNSVSEGPEQGKAFWKKTDDGVTIRVGVWNSDLARSGTVFVFPGRGECVEKYGRAARDFESRGFSTIVIDWRGQGASDRIASDKLVGHVDDFRDYQKDVAEMVAVAAELSLPKPWFLFGHSMGANIGVRAISAGLPVASCVFTAPMFGIKMTPVQRVGVWPLTVGAKLLGKAQSYIPGGKGKERESYVLSVPFDENRLTNSSDMWNYMVRIATELPHLQTAAPSMGWVLQGLIECRRIAQLPFPKVPVLVFCGEDDELVDIDAIKARVANRPNSSLVMISNGRHDLLSESSDTRKKLFDQMCGRFENEARAL